MNRRPRIGVACAPDRLAELDNMGRTIETLGFDELWLTENVYGAAAAVETALAGTKTLRVGLDLAVPSGASALGVATDLAALADRHRNRLVFAIGRCVHQRADEDSAAEVDRLSAAVRALLHGEGISFTQSSGVADRVRLESPPESPPPVLARRLTHRAPAKGHGGVDGVLVPIDAGAGALERVAAAFRGKGILVVYACMSVHDDAGEALPAPPHAVNGRSASLTPPASLTGTHYRRRKPAVEPGSAAIARTPDGCAREVMRLGRAGASSVVLASLPGSILERAARFAEDVLPLVIALTLH